MSWSTLLWVLGGTAVVSAVAAAAGGGSKKNGYSGGYTTEGSVGPVQAAWAQVEGQQTRSGNRTYNVLDTWKCARAKDQTLPIVGLYEEIPEPLRAGPIGVTIGAGINIVKRVFDELGWRRVCTLRGGKYDKLEKFRANAVKVWVQLSVQFAGLPQVHYWVWQTDDVSSTGALPLRRGDPDAPPGSSSSGESYVPGPRSAYLVVGGEPPYVHGGGAGGMWPHPIPGGGEPKWQASIPADLEQPRADLVRTEADLSLMLWIPPRAPLSQYDGPLRRYRAERKVQWRVDWVIEKLS